MADARKSLGAFGERLAGTYLEKLGYFILERNFRCSSGEIDIVAQEGTSLAFVEVRTRKSKQFGSPEESITPAKMTKLIELAEVYLQQHPESPDIWRIDVVAIELSRNGKVSRIELIRNAVN